MDDGSTDESGRILDAYSSRDKRIRVFHQPNQGVGPARNKGLEESIGDWIGYVDSDDVISRVWLEKACIIAAQDDVDMITYGQETFDERGVQSVSPAVDPCFTGFFQSLYRRSVLGGVRFPCYSMGEDRVYTFRCFVLSKRNVLCPEIMYRYRLRPGSATKSYRSFKKRRDAFLSSLQIVMLSFRIKWLPKRWRLRFCRAMVGNFMDLMLGVR